MVDHLVRPIVNHNSPTGHNLHLNHYYSGYHPFSHATSSNGCHQAVANVNMAFDDNITESTTILCSSELEQLTEGSPDDASPSASEKSYDHVVFEVMKVEPENFAKQITLIEMSLFKKIQREEFLSFKWNARDKLILAPNIVASTKWFNQLNFWVQHEILSRSAVNRRAEMLGHFIKIAKYLVNNLNNLYSAMAIITGLQVQCIYRLRQTWSALSGRERTTFRRLEELFSQKDNCMQLREQTEAMKQPGIPYLGLALSDLTYINVAHSGHESQSRTDKIDGILKVIELFQHSEYGFPPQSYIQNYLLSQRYIEELQKIIEDGNHAISSQLEPDRPITPPRSDDDLDECNLPRPISVLAPLPSDQWNAALPSDQSGRERTISIDTDEVISNQSESSRDQLDGRTPSIDDLDLARVHLTSMDSCSSIPLEPGTPQSSRERQQGKHRKSKSVGTAIQQSVNPPNPFLSASRSRSRNASRELEDCPKINLLDDSVIDESVQATFSPGDSSDVSGLASIATAVSMEQTANDEPAGQVLLEGVIQRKTVRRNGRPTRLCMWRRYWLQVIETEAETSLLYYRAKAFRATERKQFSKKSYKVQSLRRQLTLAEPQEDPIRSLQLIDPQAGHSYRLRSAGGKRRRRTHETLDVVSTQDWYLVLTEAIRKLDNMPDPDLIQLCDSRTDLEKVMGDLVESLDS